MKFTSLIILFTLGILNFAFGSFEKGLRLYEKGEYDRAIQAFEAELMRGETGAVRHNLSVAHLQNGNSGEAVWNMERAVLLNPENEAYNYKLGAMREQLGLPPITPTWQERITSLLTHDQWLRALAYLGITAFAAAMIPIAAGWKHNTRVRIVFAVSLVGTAFSAIALTHVKKLANRGISLAEVPTELHAAPASAAPQTGLIRTGERAMALESHNDYLRVSTEGGAEGWIHSGIFRKIH